MLNERLVDHDKRLELYRQGLTDREIAERLNYSRSTIRGWRGRNGLPMNRATESEVAEILRNNPDFTIKKICKMTNRSEAFVRMVAKKNELKTNGQVRWAKMNHKERTKKMFVKLYPKEVRERFFKFV